MAFTEEASMTQWFYIRKKDRDSRLPYSGPSCERAGVDPGKWYDDEDHAKRDAEALSSVNAVGFEVVRWVNPDHDSHFFDE